MNTLKDIRTSLGWTQEHMAKELEISLRSYCRQEKRGGSQTLRKLATMISQHAKSDDQKSKVIQPDPVLELLQDMRDCLI